MAELKIIERHTARSTSALAAGKHTITVETTIAGPGREDRVLIKVDGTETAATTLERTVPAAFTASESLDIGADLGSTVSNDYFDRRPFEFNGRIHSVKVHLK